MRGPGGVEGAVIDDEARPILLLHGIKINTALSTDDGCLAGVSGPDHIGIRAGSGIGEAMREPAGGVARVGNDRTGGDVTGLDVNLVEGLDVMVVIPRDVLFALGFNIDRTDAIGLTDDRRGSNADLDGDVTAAGIPGRHRGDPGGTELIDQRVGRVEK